MYKKLWLRLGVSLSITEAEEADIFVGNDLTASEAVRRIVSEGRFKLDGDSYIPGVTIEEYNEEYGTDYVTEDLGFDL